MKALFCHDGPTYIDNNKNYYACILRDDLIERYYTICDEFTLLNRLRKISNDETKKLEEIQHKNCKIKEIPNLATLKGIIFDRKKAKKIIKSEVEKSDIVIARLPGFAGSFALEYAKKLNKPYLVEMVGCPLDALSNHSIKGKLMAPIMYIYTKKKIKNAKYVMYVTNEFLQNRYPTKGYQIGCSDVEIVIDENIKNKRLNKIDNMKEHQEIVLGSLGTLNMKYKGYDLVIKALNKLNKEKIKYRYVIVGQGDDTWLRSIISKYHAEEYIEIKKAIPHKKVFEWLDNKIDIYIQPSRTEGMPRALIEAMSRACPCIGSNVGGIPELLNSEMIFRKGNFLDICKILRKLTRQKMKEESNENFIKVKEFSREKLDKKRGMLFNNLITSIKET